MKTSPASTSFRFGRRAGFLTSTGRVLPLIAGGDGPTDDGAPTEHTIEVPEDLTALTPEQLTGLLDQAVAAFDGLYDAGVSNPEATPTEIAEAQAALAQLADAIDLVRGEQSRREAEAEAAQADADALRNRVHGTDDTPAEGAEGDDAPAAEDDTPPAEGEDGTPAPEGTDDAPAADDAPVPELVAAARPGRIRVPLGAVARRAPEQPDEDGVDNDRVVITAASDVPGIATGSELDLRGVAQAAHSRVRGLRDGSDGVVVASIHRPGLMTVNEAMNAEQIGEFMDQLVASALTDGITSLLASGGWCGPSETLWDFFNIATTDGLIDLPTFGVDRAGITWPVSPSIADALSAPWLWTEDDDEAAAGNPHVDPDDDVTKPCVTIPCPTWAEARLRAHGICLTSGNLADRAFPERGANFSSLVLAAHEHLMSYRNIVSMVAASNAVTIAASTGATAQILNAVELQVIDYRSKYRMAEGAVLEAVFPTWVRGVIRADLAQRTGVDFLSVTDQQIQAWFTLRSVRPQFVQDWLPMQLGTGEVGGGDGYAEAYPATVKFLLYAAGTFVRGLGGTIDLGVVRDSALNATNDHTAMWSEEFDLVAKRGHESRVVTVPLAITGATYNVAGA